MFYIGIVENNIDPLKLGRLQVRVFGIHTFNRSNTDEQDKIIPTNDLPWAYPIFPNSNSCTDGISDFSGIVNGTRVAIIYMDKYQQQPFYLGVLPYTFSELPDFRNGFTDFAKQHPSEDFKNESSISRLARNEKIDKTCVKLRNDNTLKWNVNGTDYEEPQSSYEAEYPYNRVIETEGGLVFEMDSTPQKERIHLFHPLDTYIEVRPDGSKVQRTTGINIEVNAKDKSVSIGQGYSCAVGGTCDVELYGATNISTHDSKAPLILNLKGDIIINADGENGIGIISTKKVNLKAPEVNISAENTKITCEGKNPIINIEENGTINATKNLTINAGEKTTVTSQSDTIVTSQGDTTITSNGKTTVTSQGEVDITSSARVVVQGSTVELN